MSRPDEDEFPWRNGGHAAVLSGQQKSPREGTERCRSPGGASGRRISTAFNFLNSRCSATLVSISPDAIGVSSAASLRRHGLRYRRHQAWPFDPSQTKRLHRAAHTQSSRMIPLLVSIDHQSRATIKPLLYGLQTRGISARHSGCPTFILIPPMPASIDRSILSSNISIGVDRKLFRMYCSKLRTRDGRLGELLRGINLLFRFAVPKAVVKGCNGLGSKAATPHRRTLPRQVLSKAGQYRLGPLRSGSAQLHTREQKAPGSTGSFE